MWNHEVRFSQIMLLRAMGTDRDWLDFNFSSAHSEQVMGGAKMGVEKQVNLTSVLFLH